MKWIDDFQRFQQQENITHFSFFLQSNIPIKHNSLTYVSCRTESMINMMCLKITKMSKIFQHLLCYVTATPDSIIHNL